MVASPLWNLAIVERTSPTQNEVPLLLDSRRLGVWYMGTLRMAADMFKGFRANTTDLWFEVTV